MRDSALTFEQVSIIVKMARDKMSPKDISLTTGIDANTIRVRLCRMRKSGILSLPEAVRTTPLTDDELREFFKAHAAKTIAQIHRETGHARDYITRLMDRWVRM